MFLRYGLLAIVVAAFIATLTGNTPMGLDFSQWYAAAALGPLITSAVLLLFGFWTALAGQPLFRDELESE